MWCGGMLLIVVAEQSRSVSHNIVKESRTLSLYSLLFSAMSKYSQRTTQLKPVCILVDYSIVFEVFLPLCDVHVIPLTWKRLFGASVAYALATL